MKYGKAESEKTSFIAREILSPLGEKIILHFYKCIEQRTLGVRRKTQILMHLRRREFDRKYVHFKR